MYILMVVQNVHLCIIHMTLCNFFHMQKGVCMRKENATSKDRLFLSAASNWSLLGGWSAGRQPLKWTT